jgi:hypothetical protein
MLTKLPILCQQISHHNEKKYFSYTLSTFIDYQIRESQSNVRFEQASISSSMMKDPTGKHSSGSFDSQYPHLLYFGKI